MVSALVLLSSMAVTVVRTADAATAGTTSGFVKQSGTELEVYGKPWKFAGYNLPCDNPFLLSSSQLTYYLEDIQENSGANTIRVWFFQSEGGPGNWSNFDRVISALKARGMRAIVTLTNETSTCDEPDAHELYKPLSWYQTGYKSPEGGYALSFESYATAVAKHYADEPTVAFWQLVNEAQAPTYTTSGQLTCDETAARDALRSFADAMVADIRAVDPNHLIDLGTQGSGQCGEVGTDYTYVHAGAVNLCEYHDYGAPNVALPGGANGLATRVSECRSLKKPFFVGESGIPANVGPNGLPNSTCEPWPDCSPDPITIESLDQRAAFFKAKIHAANAAGIAGYVIWVKSPFYTDSTDGYDIADGDPTEAVLASALAPYPTAAPASLPESPLGAGLMVAVAGTATAATVIRQRGRCHATSAESQ